MVERINEAGADAPAGRRRETILIIEDDPGVARREARHRTRAGYAPTVVGTVAEGRRALREGDFDLLVLDQNLDGTVSGLDFHEQIRAEGSETPAILVTGLSDERILLRAMRSGLRDFVPKTPDFLDDLSRAVDRVMAQVRTRRKLAESETKLAGVTLLAEAIPQIVWAARPDGFVEYFNIRWYDYTGLLPEQSEGASWRSAIHPDDEPRAVELWARSVASGAVLEVEFRLRRGDGGDYRWFLSRAELVRDLEGRSYKWFGTCTDIDDKKRSEQELKHANELAETASRAKDQFLAMLSHELRTPLTPILLAASAAKDDPSVPEHLHATFDFIRQNLELEARLIDDLLDVMRIVRGKMPYQFEVIDAHVQIARAVEICRSDAEAKKLTLGVELAAHRRHLDADPARFQQVLWNLMKNAIKFTPEGGALAIRTRSEGDRLIVEVQDTGIGIAPEHLPLIFNAFEQGEDAITRRFGGLGLGLAISRSIVEGHRGAIEAISEGRDRGTTFRVALPTVAAASADDRVPAPHFDRSGEPRAKDFDLDLRILLVEDDVMTSRIMAKLLRGNGYGVTTANNVASALAVPSMEYDLVVSDIGLPDGSGLDLIRLLRDRRDVPGIALTGYGMDDDVHKSREAGFVAHLIKPLDFTKLDAMIRKVASEQGSARQA